MATLINQENTTGIAYSVSGETSTAPWSYAFGNSIWWKVWTSTASSMWVKHPAVTCEFWRFSIASQSWVHVHSVNIGKSSQTIYRVRNNQMPEAGTLRAEYNGDDSYLFAFRAYTYEGERSRTGENLYIFNVGDDTQYNTTVKGKYIYGRSLDYAYRWHLNSSLSLTLTDSWLTTLGLRRTQITSGLMKRMVSVKSAISKT